MGIIRTLRPPVNPVLAERGSSLLLRVIGERSDAETKIYECWWGERRVDGWARITTKG